MGLRKHCSLLLPSLLQVLPGGRIPADGHLVVGSSYINEAMITGESQPVWKQKGDTLIGGTINTGGLGAGQAGGAVLPWPRGLRMTAEGIWVGARSRFAGAGVEKQAAAGLGARTGSGQAAEAAPPMTRG